MNQIHEIKKETVRQFKLSNLSIRKFAELNGIPPTTLWNWTQQFSSEKSA